MTKNELVNSLQKRDPLLANAVSNMVDYISDRFPAAYPSKEQTEAVNNYLHSVYADGDGTMSERNCEHRRIASQKITINAIQVLDSSQLDRLQRVLDHIAYDKGVLYARERLRHKAIVSLLTAESFPHGSMNRFTQQK